nr:adenylate/guanylate cyclase domain-containing protein [Bacteroidota bacterium]
VLNTYFYLSELYDKLGNFKEALSYYRFYTSLKDTIFNEEKHKQFAEFQTKYETEKKEAQIIIQQTEIDKREAENKRQRAIIVSGGIVILLVILMIINVFRNLQRKKRDNKIIAAEKAKSEELLLNTLPLKVVNDLKETGSTEPEGFENVTVYFSDIVGFTDVSATLEPKVLIEELNDIFTAFDDIMVKNECERLKTIGDAYLAVCGMPEENDNHAQNMVNSAIEIVHYLEKRNMDSQIKWRIRIGIHSGRVVGGIVGVRKYIYDVFGDTINTASRMESNGSPMRINVSQVTFELLKEKFKFTKREERAVKGKGAMQMYFVDY